MSEPTGKRRLVRFVSEGTDERLRERDLHSTRWIVRLDDGREIRQDDDPAGGREPGESSWLSLARWLRENPDRRIVSLSLRFRDEPPRVLLEEMSLPVRGGEVRGSEVSGGEEAKTAKGWFYREAAFCLMGGGNENSVRRYALIGRWFGEGRPVEILRVRIPEMIVEEIEFRDSEDPGLCGESLIGLREERRTSRRHGEQTQ